MSFYGKNASYNRAVGDVAGNVAGNLENQIIDCQLYTQPQREHVLISFSNDEFLRFGTKSITYADYCLLVLVFMALNLIVSIISLSKR